MVLLPVLVLVGVIVAVYALAHRHAAAPAGAAGASAHRRLAPTSRVGTWSLWVLLAAVVMQFGLSTAVGWAGAPFGAASFVLALLAMVREHDRSPLLWLPVVVGSFVAGFPFLFWWLS
jgi:hypothetical protein